jgi:Nif-specific regulatory protein
VLEVLDRHHGAVRSTVVLVNQQTSEIELEASAGAIEPGRRVRYRIGEGITGQVLQSGRPIVVPQVSREPAFLYRASARPEVAREELTYISVPISLDNQTVGALAIDLRFKPDRDHQRMVKFLGVAGSMIAHAVKVHRLVEADRQKLLAENSHLREELKQRYDFSNIIGTSGPMRRVYEQVAQVARTNTTVMVRGESGTGKELIANALHYNSPRAKAPLIKVNCGALPHDR